ncbi:MAG: multiheme c-type cytochrome [Myxococcota bacterium]
MAQAYLTAGLTTSMLALVTLTTIDDAFAGPDHIGAERCGACHQAEYQAWRKTPHAQALARLSETQQQNPLCRSCHTMDPWSDDPALAGVQCESCHGPGLPYAPDLVMRDKKLARLMGLEAVNEKTCENCHRADAPRLRPFDYAKLVKQVMHLPPESATPSE